MYITHLTSSLPWGKRSFFLFCALLFSFSLCAEQVQLKKTYHYTYLDRPHSWSENIAHWGALFGLASTVYVINQAETIEDHASFHNWRENFGRLTFDKDEPYWNWIAHPYVGSQMYLYFRANGYDQFHALKMTFVQSAIFELVIENLTERPSFQDLYQTPVLGSMLGYGLEKLSLYMFNSGHSFLRWTGYLLNPWPLFWFYEGKLEIIPEIRSKDEGKVTLRWEF